MNGLDEKYLELLADYAARQSQEKRERKLRDFKQREVDAKKKALNARHVHVLASSAHRSAAVHEAYKHALLLALSGRSASSLGAGDASAEEN